ncbi:GNAT family N-acetyltransferase [Bacillus sp. BRMEA1]|uniref:GNAT family N-acetyltransferase n=1 Tax=Neobacillus endophyticus TaxID=2738405 RepID=UPI001564CBD7|nr:GNAT family N-acetyltransferase [Neobacillus endophyticus]NRD78291.1 GNAT family N-acetyltransferase [Neobacillus endophyticus]
MFQVREAFPFEWERIKQKRINAYKEYAEVLPSEHWRVLSESISVTVFEPNVQVFVATENQKIVGSVVLFPPKMDAYAGLTDLPESPEIRMLAIDPKARHQGIAEALLRHCIQACQQSGFSAVGLHTADFMKSAMRLYARLKFVRVPELDFVPLDDGIVVKAFQYSIEKEA